MRVHSCILAKGSRENWTRAAGAWERFEDAECGIRKVEGYGEVWEIYTKLIFESYVVLRRAWMLQARIIAGMGTLTH